MSDLPSDLAARVERFKAEYQPIFEALMPILDEFTVTNRHDSGDQENPSMSYLNVSTELEEIVLFLTSKDPRGFIEWNYLDVADRAFPTAEALYNAKNSFEHQIRHNQLDGPKAAMAAKGSVLISRLGDAFAKECDFSGPFGGRSFISDLDRGYEGVL